MAIQTTRSSLGRRVRYVRHNIVPKCIIRQIYRQRRFTEVLEIKVDATGMIERHLGENIGFLTEELCRIIRVELPNYIRRVSARGETESLRAVIHI